MTRYSTLLLLLSCCFFTPLAAQTLSIGFKNPDTLFVCGESRFEITLNNSSTTAAGEVRTKMTLPAGVRYVPGSVLGANEANISNTALPEFSVTADIPGGGTTKLTVLLRADCGAIAPLNNGAIFTNSISATWNGGGSTQITTGSYKVETGLVLITSVTPLSLSGKAGEIVTRTITIKNTRQGPINLLKFSDQHLPGLSMQLTGIGGQNIGTTFFQVDVPGNIFTTIGDGDNLLEFNEILVLTEQITITACQDVSFPISSVIRVGWGCDGTLCQSDTAQAAVIVLPSDLNPNLRFSATYRPPFNLCAQTANVQEIKVINTGGGAAQNVQIDISAFNPAGEAIQGYTARWFNGSVWLPLSAAPGKPVKFTDCPRDSLFENIVVTVPVVPAGDTILVQFTAYNCNPTCSVPVGSFRGKYFYNKICPASDFANGIIDFDVDTFLTNMDAVVEFEIGRCLQDNEVNTFDYKVRTGLLKQDSAYLHVAFNLPWGIFWDPSCPLILDGKSPVTTQLDTMGRATILKLVYQLPFSKDSASGKICLRNVCQDPSTYLPPVDSIPARSLPLTIFQVEPGCLPCEQLVNVVTQVSKKPDIAEKCGYSACDQFKLVLNCGCDIPPAIAGSAFSTQRSNLGFRDDNDDRKADSNARANSALVRLDRFMTGDTMHTNLRVKVPEGGLQVFDYRIFTELWNSDVGIDGGDNFNFVNGSVVFTNADKLKYLGGTLLLKKANGATYECKFNQVAALSDQHGVLVARPNNKPPSIVDNGASMFRQFSVDPKKLAAAGCMPAGTTLSAGDSIIITGDYKLDFNFTASTSARPPLVNFRNTVCGTDRVIAGKFDSLICRAGVMLQYTGHIESAQFPIYGIRVCENAAEILPFKYNLRIARGNLFPFEVRPIAKLQTLLHDLPAVLPLPTATLRSLNLQETTPVLTNQPMTPTLAGGRIRLDFNPFFQSPMDEGFNAVVGLTFAPNCSYTGAVSNTRSSVSVLYNNICLRDPVLSTLDSARLAYFAAAPRLNLALKDSILNVSTEIATANFELENTSPFEALNSWVVVESDGSLDDLEILRLPGLQPVPRIGTVWQTGTLGAFSSTKFILRAKSNSCKKITIKLTYGWNCVPLNSLASETCGAQTQTIQLRPLFPVLELVSPTLLPPLRLCTPSEYYEFEIYNANEGRAYDVVGQIKLPPGFRILPNTSQLSYPSGSPFVNLPEPQPLPGNTWKWNPEAVSAALKNEGLLGNSQTPGHSMRIRFKVQAECGATANSQPVFGTEAVLPCGIGSNTLRKPGPPIAILGLMPSYSINPTLTAAGPLLCGATMDITASLSADGVPGAGDSLYINLPPGVSYIDGSYTAGSNAPSGPPQRIGAALRLPLPTAWPVGSTLKFTFKIKYDNPAGCDDKIITLAAREKATANCANQNCAAFITTGETALTLSTRNPELVLKNPVLTLQNNQPGFSASLENISIVTALMPLVQVFYDQNGNGVIEAGEPLVGAFQQTQNMNPGIVRAISGALTLPAGASYCNLIAVIPATENCACSARLYPFDGRPTITTALGRCKLEAVPIKGDSTAGHTYQWLTTTGISCTTCPNTIYTPGPGVQIGQLVTLLLEDRFGNCVVERRYDIQFGGPLGLLTPNQTICKGQTVLLEATPGGTYSWSGSGISGTTTSSILVQPAVIGINNYRVTVTLPGGCIGSSLTRINVLRPDTLTLPAKKTCTGNPVSVLDEVTDQPGKYARILTGTDGCDSVILQELRVYPNLTQEVRPLCQGDSTQVFNKWVKKPGVVCASFNGFSGCDSLHCVDVKSIAPPVLPVPDSVVLTRGQTVTLVAPPGLANYVWTPQYNLSCNTCPNPNANPDTSIIYTLRVADSNGCENQVGYRVIVFPPCFEGFAIPNAFTPDGDQINDTFRAVPNEGYEKVRSLTIYSRWGEKVFQSTTENPQWDGNISGKAAPMDVYFWLMTVDCRGEIREEKGEVTLLR